MNRVDATGTASLNINNLDLLDDQISSDSGGGGLGKTSGGFRSSLKALTQQSGSGQHAHHVFPKHFTSQFKKIGIDNQKAIYGAWWDATGHLKNSYKYDQWWSAFFDIPGVTKQDAFSLADFLSKLFDFDLNF